MIEQRTMFVVEASHRVQEILAMYDTEKGEVVCYHYTDDSDWFGKYDDDRYFSTRQQADDYVSNRQAQLRAKFPEIKAFIEEVQKTDKEVFVHEDEEYMGAYAPRSSQKNSWFREFKEQRNKAGRYLQFIKTGYLSMSGISFRPEDVDYIKWYKDDKAKVFLKNENGTVIETSNKQDYTIIEELFGGNRSDMEFEMG
jgi:hypothetical protein